MIRCVIKVLVIAELFFEQDKILRENYIETTESELRSLYCD